jgi:hypothetical protein
MKRQLKTIFQDFAEAETEEKTNPEK